MRFRPWRLRNASYPIMKTASDNIDFSCSIHLNVLFEVFIFMFYLNLFAFHFSRERHTCLDLAIPVQFSILCRRIALCRRNREHPTLLNLIKKLALVRGPMALFQTGQSDRRKKLHTMCQSSFGSSTSNDGCGGGSGRGLLK